MKPTSAFAALVALVMVHGIPVEQKGVESTVLSTSRRLLLRTPSAAARWHRTRAAASLPRRTSSLAPTPALRRVPGTARVWR
ncbi:hypothetical protein B0H14DRAFT_2811184, partial [Mycena olivaceomarginata]